MLHRFPTMRAYMGWQFLALLGGFLDDKRKIKDSVELAALWQNFNDSAAQATGFWIAPTITLEGQRR